MIKKGSTLRAASAPLRAAPVHHFVPPTVVSPELGGARALEKATRSSEDWESVITRFLSPVQTSRNALEIQFEVGFNVDRLV